VKYSVKKYFDFAAITIVMMTISQSAHAYIDPGSGSLLMTAIIGSIAALGYTTRKYFYKFRNLFRATIADDSEEEAESGEK